MTTKTNKVHDALVYVGLFDFINHKLVEMDDIRPEDAKQIRLIVANLTTIIDSHAMSHEEKSIAIAKEFSQLDMHTKADLVLRSAIKSTFRTFLINETKFIN